MIKRRKKKRKKKWWIIPVVVVIVLAPILFLRIEKPPVKEMEKARAVLSEAESANAKIYSRILYNKAKTLYDSAMKAWKEENKKIIFFRNFERTVNLIDQVVKVGEDAIKQAEYMQQDSKSALQEEIKVLRREMNLFERVFADLPSSSVAKSRYARGKLLLNEAEIALQKKEYNIGREKSQEASKMIGDSYKRGREALAEYFERLPVWKRELSEAIEQSKREKSYLIVVHKIPSRCDLYYKGVKKYSFPAEFGRNWLGDKRYEGDYATPEGVYKVVRKTDGRATKYYKALLINYPNEQDLINFNRLKKNGAISRNARPGGLIEIHGFGGQGVNWTMGCVALANSDMDMLYKYAETETEVVIIGASAPLEEALEMYKNNKYGER